MVAGDLIGQFTVTLLEQSGDHHVIGSRPDSALPIAAIFLVFRMVRRQRRNTVQAIEGLRVLQLGHECVQPIFRQDVGQ